MTSDHNRSLPTHRDSRNGKISLFTAESDDTAIYCNIHKRSDVDSCQVCEGENPIRERVFKGIISFPLNYLTQNGEMTEEEGWAYIQKDLNTAISNLIDSRDMGPVAEFLEWDEDAINLNTY